MAKITDMLPDRVSVDSSFVNGEIKFISDPLPKIDEVVFNTVFKALKLHRTLSFDYRKINRNDYTPRIFNPYHVICQKGSWYVIGFCYTAKEIRVYTLSRITNIACTEKTFEIPTDFDLSKHIDPSFGIWNKKESPKKIELLFDKDVGTYVVERSWHKTQEIRRNKDGTVYLSFETNQTEETLYRIMQFCGAVKVLSPPELIAAVKNAAKKILEKQ